MVTVKRILICCPPETFTSSYLHHYMHSTAPSKMSVGPASLYKQAQRVGKPLNLSAQIVDRWLGSPFWQGRAKTM